MDWRNSTEMFDSCNSFADGEMSSPQIISTSLIKMDNESLHCSEKRHNSLQESFCIPVLYNGRSYARKVKANSNEANVEMLKIKSLLEFSTDVQASYSIIQHQNNDLPTVNFKEKMHCFSDETKLCQEIRDSSEDLTRTCHKEKELKNPVLKDLIKNIETFYADENASSKASTKRVKCNNPKVDISSSNEILKYNLRNSTQKDDSETVWYECQKCHLEFCTPKGLANHVKTHPKLMIEKNMCVYCGKGFDGVNDLGDHLNAEHLFSVMNYTCESCLIECISADLFDKHQYSCHRKQDTSCLFCSNCDKVYYDQEMLNYHKEQQKHCHICFLNYCMSSDQFKAHKEKHILFKYKCLNCNSSFITKAALTKHLEIRNSCFQMLCNKGVDHENSYEFDHEQVNEFGFGTGTEVNPEDNMINETNISSVKKEKIHKCPLCTAKFALVKNMWRHAAIVHQKDLQLGTLQHLPTPKGHQCTMCEKKVSRKSNLVAHMASHIRGTCSMDNGQPKCPICHKTFRLQRYLVDHMRLHTGRGTHECHHCDKKFLRRSHLKLHMEMHNSFHKFHACPHCDKTYMRKRDQIHHVRVKHGTAVAVTTKTNTKKTEGFSCSSCEKKFSSVLKLQMHEIKHTVTKPPYQCQECSQSFPTLSTLKRHYLIHWDLRPFSCFTCSKSFRYTQSLKRHMMTHTGEKPHVCKHCGKGFALKGTLNVHMQQHSTARTFKCYKCDEVFTRKQEMKSHHCNQIKLKLLAESVNTEYSVFRKDECTTYNTCEYKSKENNESVGNLVPNVLNDLSSVALISDSCVDNLVPVAGLNSNITNNVLPLTHLVTEVNNEIITLNGAASNNSISDTQFEVQFSDQPSDKVQPPQVVEANFGDNALLEKASHLQNMNQTDSLAEVCTVVGENRINESVNLGNCSVLETNQQAEAGECTIYTLVTIDGELEQPTFISIPTISDSGNEENVTLQINFPEDGCSEVFIIKS